MSERRIRPASGGHICEENLHQANLSCEWLSSTGPIWFSVHPQRNRANNQRLEVRNVEVTDDLQEISLFGESKRYICSHSADLCSEAI